MTEQVRQTASVKNTGGQHALVDQTHSKPFRVIQVVAHLSASTIIGWPVGFWAAELAHPYYEVAGAGCEVTIASPDGGNVAFDNLSDPHDPSKWSVKDLISMGFVNTPDLMR